MTIFETISVAIQSNLVLIGVVTVVISIVNSKKSNPFFSRPKARMITFKKWYSRIAGL